jgi:uncharacterized protein (TIGR00251 family)
MQSWIEERGGAVRIRVRAQPRASRTELAGEHGNALKIRLAAPPVDGEANRELCRFIAKRLGVAPSLVRVVAGESGRDKTVEVVGADAARAAAALRE